MDQLKDTRYDWWKNDIPKYDINYQETFAPVTNMKSIKVLLSVAANKGWPL